MKTWRRVALLAVWLVGTAASLWGQPPARRPMTLVDLLEVPRLLDPQLSADGRHLLYQLNRADWKANRRIGHVWRQELSGGAPTQLTFGDTGESTPRWAPDGSSLLFLARRGDNPDIQIFLMPVDGGEARALTRHATSVSSPSWSPDGRAIYFLATEARTSDERERERVRDDITPFEENGRARQLWNVNVSTGVEQRVTSGDLSVVAYRLSRDGARIVVHRAPTTMVADAFRSEIWLMDVTGENGRAVTDNAIEESEAELSPDNGQLLFLADASPSLEPYYNTNLFLVAASGGLPRALLPDFRYAVDRAQWSPDGRSIFAVVNMGVHSEIFQIDVASKAVKQLTEGRHSIPPPPAPTWNFVPAAGRMVFQLDEPTRFGDVWALSVASGTPVRVTSVYDNLERDFLLPRQEKFEWTGVDGATLEGLLVYPLDYREGTRYPLVVQMHGGPQESDKFGFGAGGNGWPDYIQILAANGYAVFRPNYRGSTGYGNAFMRDVVGRYFRNQHTDVLSGVDALVRKGLIDSERMAVMGWSAGGHLTNKIVTFTDRFKAASSGASAANWVSLFAQTDTRANRALWFGGTPYQKDAPWDLYWSESPVKYAASVKTPTLFLVGENDVRVPAAQSMEMYRALKSNGVPTKLYIAPREGHQWGELRHQLFKMNVELEWFERYTTGRPYTWEKAPGDAAVKSFTK